MKAGIQDDYLDLNCFIISWGDGEEGRVGGGVTINDGWEGVPDFESTLRSLASLSAAC